MCTNLNKIGCYCDIFSTTVHNLTIAAHMYLELFFVFFSILLYACVRICFGICLMLIILFHLFILIFFCCTMNSQWVKLLDNKANIIFILIFQVSLA
ncbi:unnamed protein product [Callosobruchus maculatus]|uniref:Uncharacterized protein n=1 Tax=Callosobruchus maculatus TaxID=64391 RepID=A0A653C9C2_CALMS|nr:unnamed protein product [Callosobruchus maculatus]